MRTSRIVLVSTSCAALCGIALMSGPAGKSYAQNPPQASAAPPVGLLPVAPTDPGAGLGALPSLPNEPQVAPYPSLGSTEPLGVSVPGSPRAVANQDPEQVALEFVLKNQKVAEQELVKLKSEAETLRTRLIKVEAAIRRWEAVAHALKQSEGVASKADGTWKPEAHSRNSRIEFDEDTPSDLQAIPADKIERASAPASPKLKLKKSTSSGPDHVPPVAPIEDDALLPVAPSPPAGATEPAPTPKS